jgi:hypothetical protein
MKLFQIFNFYTALMFYNYNKTINRVESQEYEKIAHFPGETPITLSKSGLSLVPNLKRANSRKI